MNFCKMFYEDDSDLMVKLRPYVCGDRINIPMSNVLSRKWNKVVNTETCDARPANPLLDAFLNGPNAFVLLIVADVLHNLKLSVSFEMFKRETGFDPFDAKNNAWATSEIAQLRCEAGPEEVTALVEPLIWVLSDIQMVTQQRSGRERNYAAETWQELGIDPRDIGRNSAAANCFVPQELLVAEEGTRRSRRRSATPKLKIPLYKRVSSVDLLGGCDRY